MANKTTLTFSVDLDIEKVKGSVAEIQRSFKQLNLSKSLKGSSSKVFSELEREIENFQSLSATPPTSTKEAVKVEASLKRIGQLLSQIDQIKNSIGDDPLSFISDKDKQDIRDMQKALGEAKKALSGIDSSKLASSLEAAKKEAEGLDDDLQKLENKINKKKEYEVKIEANKKELLELQKQLDQLTIDPVRAKKKTVTAEDGTKSTVVTNAADVEAYKQKVLSLREQIRALKAEQKDWQDNIKSLNVPNDADDKVAALKKQLDEAQKGIEVLQNKLSTFEADSQKEINTTLSGITGQAVDQIPGDTIESVNTYIQSWARLKGYRVEGTVKNIGEAIEQTSQEAKKGADAASEQVEAFKELDRVERNINDLKSQILNFFSVDNTIQIFKDAVREAFETVKELDAVMTQTAVVTDFSVGDMWSKLPEYSNQATKLGTSISSLYEATTLYYQQGLDSEEAMSVGIETMKMARVANLGAAEATQAMTAALRGFNMEINEASATRISDVYSKLAAITAADTGQIATAMSKTASIASSANMEFETTAALLAQIIETTQEAPETAGTAMKTIIARFTEVKELFDEGMMTGEDEEGEAININKIDAALKTVGISLSDFLNGTKGIDDIFLELASKWDSLDLATQRYIATTAAGSRQQSRFIAMMSNYDRTMELVNSANNSAGASNEQFGKTLDSLDAKLARLQNAWQEFTMGLANNQAIKTGIDILTMLLETVNSVTETLSFGNEGIKGLMNLGLVFGSLDLGGNIFESVLKSIKTEGFQGSKTKIAKAFMDVLIGPESLNQWSKLGEVFKNFGGIFPKMWSTIKTFGIGLGKFLISPLGVAIGAITLITIALVSLKKAFDGAQETARLDSLKQNASTLSSELTKAKDSLSEMAQERKELDQLQESLEGLVEGTNEWKSKIIETNQEVLSLIEKFAVLSDYVGTGEFGQLIIKAEGWEALEVSLQEQILNTTANQIAVNDAIKDLELAESFEEAFVSLGDGRLEKWGLQLMADLSDFYDKYRDFQLLGIGQGWGQINDPVMALATKAVMETATPGTILGGLSEEQFNSILHELFQAGYTNRESINAEILADFLPEGYNADYLLAIINGMDKFDQYLNEVGDRSLSLGESEQNFIQTALLGQKNIASDYTSVFTDVFSQGNLDYITELENKIDSLNEEEMSYEEQYYKMTGKGYYSKDDGKLYTDYSMTEELTIGEEAMKVAIATAMLVDQYQELGIGLQTTLKETGTDMKLFTKFFTEEGTAMDEEFIKQWQDQDLTAIAKGLGFETEEALASAMNMSVEDLGDLVYENINMAKERIVKERDTLAQAFIPDDKTIQGLQEQFAEHFSFTDLAGDVYTALGPVNDELQGAVRAFIQERSMDPYVLQQGLEAIADINFSNPIQAVAQLNKLTEQGSVGAKELAEDLLDIDSAALSASAQMNYLLATSEWDKIDEELTEIFDLNQEINASDVNDLKNSYKSLGQIMENTGITASGMAKILEEVHQGDIGFNQLTNSVLTAATAINTLEDNASSALAAIESFESRRTNDDSLSDFIGQASTQLSEDVAAGHWGGKSRDYLDFLLGPGWADEFEGGVKEAMRYYEQVLKDNSQNMRASWAQLASGQNIHGETTTLGGGLEVLEENGEIVLKGFENLTTEDVVKEVMKAYDVTRTYAELMVNDFKINSDGMADILAQNDFGAAMAKVYESLGEDGIIDMSEIEAIAELLNSTTDDVIEGLEEHGEIVTTQFYEDGELKKGLDLLNEVAEAYGAAEESGQGWANEMVSVNEDGSLSIDSLKKHLQDANFTEEMQNETLTAWARAQEEGKATFTETINGETVTFEVTPEIDYATALNNALSEAATTRQAEIMKEVFGDMPISLTVSPESTEEAKAAIELVTQDKTITITTDLAEGQAEELQAQLNELDLTVGVGAVLTDVTRIVEGLGGKVTGKTSVSKAVGTTATGIKNSPTTYDSLTGEEGPELVQKAKGGAYLVGTHGPEFARIEKGDTVYTAEETRQILKSRKHRMFSRYQGGKPPVKKLVMKDVDGNVVELSAIKGYGNGEEVGGGGSGGDAKDIKSAIENPFDKLYNLLREIDEELRQRERIERRYEKLLEGIDASADQIIALSREELAQLEYEQKLQEELIAGREAQIEEYLAENAELNKFANVDKNERGEQILRIDWDAINQVNNEEEMKEIEEYVSKLEEWFDELVNAEEALWDIEDAVSEIKERGKEEYTELEDTIKEALVNAYQKEIDKLSEINQSIEDSNSSLLDAINETIDLQRQTRDNQDKERELAEKQRRLSYLEQDTSGANALEILQLRKELEEGQRDYTDELIDQKIDELSKQNEEAAKAREQQITLLQAQLDHYVESGQIWTEVYDLMRSGLDEKTGLIRGSRLEEILQNEDSFDGLSAIGKQNWWIELNNQIAQALAYLEVGRQLEDIGVAEGTRIQFTGLNGEKLSGVVNAEGDVVTDTGEVYDNVFQGANGEYFAKENQKPVEEPEEETPVIVPKDNPYGIASETKDYSAKRGNVRGGNEVKAVQWALNEMGYNAGEVDGVYGPNTAGAVSRFQAAVGMTPTGDYDALTKEQMRLKGYLRGGLADFTGPAWLDGTKSRPELVLNARDTQNFIQLKDILGAILSKNLIGNNTSTQENGGDINYDIDINVETISSDYDVDQIADRIKTLISNNARYRNNNAVSLKR